MMQLFFHSELSYLQRCYLWEYICANDTTKHLKDWEERKKLCRLFLTFNSDKWCRSHRILIQVNKICRSPPFKTRLRCTLCILHVHAPMSSTHNRFMPGRAEGQESPANVLVLLNKIPSPTSNFPTLPIVRPSLSLTLPLSTRGPFLPFLHVCFPPAHTLPPPPISPKDMSHCCTVITARPQGHI